jgi:hypothetical protein
MSGQQISSLNNGTRWFQYRAYLSTEDIFSTPSLKSVTVQYNLLHNLFFSSPSGGENWTSIHNITWSSHDPDNDSLKFDIYLDNGSAFSLLAGNLSNDTRDWQWNTNSTPNGTYRIKIVSRDDNPSIPLVVNATSGNFAIFHPPPRYLPNVRLVSPSDNSVVNSTTVHLAWHDIGIDDVIYSYCYSDNPQLQGAISCAPTMNNSTDIFNLTDNTTYSWTVDATDGKITSPIISREIWSFNVRLPPANIPVRFTSTPPATAWVGQDYSYNLTSIDEDDDIPLFSIVSAPSAMTLDSSTGKLRWTPTTSDIGNNTITIQVSDGRGSTDYQTFTITVKEVPVPPVFPPKCAITYPANGTTVKGTIKVLGTASNGSLALSIVKIRIDNGTWSAAVGLDNWNFTLNTAKLSKGHHRIEAKAFAVNLSSDTAIVDFTVDNPAPAISYGGNPWCLPAVMVAVLAGIAVLILLRKRKATPNK